jgi:hypothetical protein
MSLTILVFSSPSRPILNCCLELDDNSFLSHPLRFITHLTIRCHIGSFTDGVFKYTTKWIKNKCFTWVQQYAKVSLKIIWNREIYYFVSNVIKYLRLNTFGTSILYIFVYRLHVHLVHIEQYFRQKCCEYCSAFLCFCLIQQVPHKTIFWWSHNIFKKSAFRHPPMFPRQ